jgi:hypothetical protein
MKPQFRLLLAFACTFALLFAVNVAPSANAQTTTELVETSLTIPANGEVEVSFQGFCLDFGEPFPTSFGQPGERADDDILRVLKTALLDGTADEDPLTLNLAIWTLRENRTIEDLYPTLDSTLTEQVNDLLGRSESATVAPLATDLGVALDQAVADGQVEVTSADFNFDESAPVAVPEDEGRYYHGEGTMTIRNLTDEEITVYYAFGTILVAEDDTEQDLVTYSTELETIVQVTATPQATATAQATQAPEATATPQAPTTMPQTGVAPATDYTGTMLAVIGLGFIALGVASRLFR